MLTLYGAEDKVIDREKPEEGKRFMPEDYSEISIKDGNPAMSGDKGTGNQ